MKITSKLTAKQKDLYGAEPVTVAFLGDSVTQGCFDFYLQGNTFNTVFDGSSAYPTRFKEILAKLYPTVQVNVINSGISGDTAANGAKRYQRDVSKYSPDLVVVSFGLNDSVVGGKNGIKNYGDALTDIFKQANESGAECIFLTQNFACEMVSDRLREEIFIKLAENQSEIQSSGLLDEYFAEAKKRCEENGVKICDVRKSWQKMSENGVNVTELLSNRLNHPVREMHYYAAIKLIETIFEL